MGIEASGYLNHQCSDDDDGQEGEWEEWGNGGGDDEDEENTQTLCLFCEETLASPETVFKHCVEQHAFDFSKLRAASHLSLYDCLCLINFNRSRVSMDVCWNCGSKYDTCNALLEHLNAVKHTVLPEVTNGMPSCCEGDDDEQSEEFDVVDKDKAVRQLLDFSSMNKQSIANVVEMAAEDETSVQGLGLGDSNLADLTKVFLALGDGFWDESTRPTGASVLSNKGISSSSAEIISGVVGDMPALESDVEGENSLGIKEAVVMKKDNKDKKLHVFLRRWLRGKCVMQTATTLVLMVHLESIVKCSATGYEQMHIGILFEEPCTLQRCSSDGCWLWHWHPEVLAGAGASSWEVKLILSSFFAA
ncbi:hypothetical protein CY35_10G070900 [Sphagnum magellanicum]|nr:hypothetical protein CY35_10G070900 [Sphagnum magellanicum]